MSIIGVGITKFGDVLKTSELKGMTERELMAWAALEAMEDAGVSPRDVDGLIASGNGSEFTHTILPATVAAAWLGLELKPSITIKGACANASASLRIAGSQIASGLVDIMLIVGGSTNSTPIVDFPQIRRQPAEREELDPRMAREFINRSFDSAYIGVINGGGGLMSPGLMAYAKRYGLTLDQLDTALNAAVISQRRGGILHPKSMFYGAKDFEGIAKDEGFNNAMEYLKSRVHNPFIDFPVRRHHMCSFADGGVALVVCATELADKFTGKKPVEVAGLGQGTSMYRGWPGPSGWLPEIPKRKLHPLDEAVRDQAFTMASLDPAEIEYLAIHDPTIHNHLLEPETFGYIPEGETWQYIIDGRTAFDGDKPIQTFGGECFFGNAFEASPFMDMIEPIEQMWGRCGARQIKKPPKCALITTQGGGWNKGAVVLRCK